MFHTPVSLYQSLTPSGQDPRMSCQTRPSPPGISVAFTLSLTDDSDWTLTDRFSQLRQASQQTAKKLPFYADAWAVLPTRFVSVWTLPHNDTRLTARWQMMNKTFVSLMPDTPGALWQTPILLTPLNDLIAFADAIQHCWFAPVKEGLADTPEDWVYSSVHEEGEIGQKVA